MLLPGAANNDCPQVGSGKLELGFRYAHRCTLPTSSVKDAVETACGAVDPVQMQASGILGSPVGTQLQVTKTVFWTKCSLFFMVPPRAVHAWVLDPDAQNAVWQRA
jgi:hypothetical protein